MHEDVPRVTRTASLPASPSVLRIVSVSVLMLGSAPIFGQKSEPLTLTKLLSPPRALGPRKTPLNTIQGGFRAFKAAYRYAVLRRRDLQSAVLRGLE